MSRARARVTFLGVLTVFAVMVGAVGDVSCGGSATGEGGGSVATTASSSSAPSSVSASSSTTAASTSSGAGGMDAGAAPQWAPYPQQVVGCDVQRVSNPKDVRVFAWTPCEGVPACQRATFLGDFAALWSLGGASVVKATSSGRVVALSITEPSSFNQALFTDENGWLLDGYQTEEVSAPDHCVLADSAVAEGHHGFMELHDGNFANGFRFGGFTTSFGAATASAFEFTKFPPGGPDWQLMGDTRWFFHAPYGNLVSISSADGSDFQFFAPFDENTMVFQQDMTLVPTGVLFTRAEPTTWKIMFSDGIAAPTQYLAPADGSYYGSVGYADTHVAWMRGINQTKLNVFDSVELWASAYSADPAALQPYKVDVTPRHNDAPMGTYVAGNGRYATQSGLDPPTYGETYVYDLAKKTHTAFSLPAGYTVNDYMGITPTHLWVTGQNPVTNFDDMMVRFALP